MNPNTEPVKLKRGTLSRLARRYGVTPTHVHLCLKGERVGRKALQGAIERERERQLAKQAAA